jgi:hypothetical protein
MCDFFESRRGQRSKRVRTSVPRSRAAPARDHISLHATALGCAGSQDGQKKGSNDSVSRPTRGSPRARKAALRAATDGLQLGREQELHNALCQHHGYLLGGDGMPYPLSDDAVEREKLWAQRIRTACPSAVAPSARPPDVGTMRTSGILRRIPAMFAVVAAMPAAVDALTMHPESHDAGHFAIGAILATIFLMWTLMGCGSGRLWIVTLTATSMSSVTITALLAVVTIVETGFITEEVNSDSRSYHEAIATLVIGASWVTHLALSIYGSARHYTLRRVLSLSESTPRPFGPRPRSKHLAARQMMRVRLVMAVWPCATPTTRPSDSSVLARSIAPSSPQPTPMQRDSRPTQFFMGTPTPLSFASCCCRRHPQCPARTELSSLLCYGFSCL